MSSEGKGGKLSLASEEPVDDVATFEEVKKDLNALTKEEQMDVVHRCGFCLLLISFCTISYIVGMFYNLYVLTILHQHL